MHIEFKFYKIKLLGKLIVQYSIYVICLFLSLFGISVLNLHVFLLSGGYEYHVRHEN